MFEILTLGKVHVVNLRTTSICIVIHTNASEEYTDSVCTLVIRTVFSSKMLISTNPTTQYHDPHDHSINSYSRLRFGP